MLKFIIALLIVLPAFAGNYFPVGKQGANTTYWNHDECERFENAECFEISGKDLRYHVLKSSVVDDLEKPIYKSHYNVDSCSDAHSCTAMVSQKKCDKGDYATYKENSVFPGYKAFCTGVEGYEKKQAVDLVLDEELFQRVSLADAAKASEKDAVGKMRKRMECGKNIQALVGIKNDKKGLTSEQVKAFAQKFSDLKLLLDVGALLTAKEAINDLPIDDTISQADKDDILAAIELCL